MVLIAIGGVAQNRKFVMHLADVLNFPIRIIKLRTNMCPRCRKWQRASSSLASNDSYYGRARCYRQRISKRILPPYPENVEKI